MDIKITELVEENFKDLPDFPLFPYSCKYCAFWESSEFSDLTPKETVQRTKQEWIRRVRKEFGSCGFILYADSDPVGFAQYAPPEFFPAVSKYKAGRPSKDAVFLACLYIARRELRRRGIGRHFLERVESDLKRRGCTAIETFARVTESSPSSNVEDWYVGSAEFFIKNDFVVKSEAHGIALLRKELAQ